MVPRSTTFKLLGRSLAGDTARILGRIDRCRQSISPSARMAARSSTLRNSLTLPGQSCASSTSSASSRS